MKIAFVFGTRPEILKIYPVYVEARKQGLDTYLIHTNQHYSFELDEVFFQELNLDKPHFNLGAGTLTHNLQLAKMLEKLDGVFNSLDPDWILVQGDTNSTLAGALAASKRNIKVAHIEAGLRSYDREMPEEINRIVTDSVSDLLFPVSNVQEQILLKEGHNKNKVITVGNTIVDLLEIKKKIAKESSEILRRLKLGEKSYFLMTLHRPSNVDNHKKLQKLINSISEVALKNSKIVVWPIHPRAKKIIIDNHLSIPENLNLIEPQGYLDFLKLEMSSSIILTDSGGIQEEACILQVPCLTLRENTERPEALVVGASLLVGNSREKIENGVEHYRNFNESWENPFGNGNSSSKIIRSIMNQVI